tara:strand:- start:1187 stop:1696 length:510 start_codon:yes stop_codon:yes gene_type:complete
MKDAAVYVGSCLKYADGNLSGSWVQLNDFGSSEDFIKHCHNLHKDELFPELDFQDWENIPCNLIGQHHINPIYWEIMEHQCIDHVAMFDYLDEMVGSLAKNETAHDLIQKMEDRCCGEWSSFSDFVQEQFENLYDIPECLEAHIDWSSIEHEWSMDYTFTSNGYVFSQA